MSYYSENASAVRVDFFKSSGKWYATVAVVWPVSMYDRQTCIHAGFRQALWNCVGEQYIGMYAVCLHPYHELEHPLMLLWDGKKDA